MKIHFSFIATTEPLCEANQINVEEEEEEGTAQSAVTGSFVTSTKLLDAVLMSFEEDELLDNDDDDVVDGLISFKHNFRSNPPLTINSPPTIAIEDTLPL